MLSFSPLQTTAQQMSGGRHFYVMSLPGNRRIDEWRGDQD